MTKKDPNIGTPKTLRRTRNSLKFIVKVMKNHLSMDSVTEKLLRDNEYDNEGNNDRLSEEEESSSCCSSESNNGEQEKDKKMKATEIKTK